MHDTKAIAVPLPAPAGGQEDVPSALIALLERNREVLGAKWVDLVIPMIRERTAFGIRKYGQSLKTFDGRPPHLDALQELIDLFQYLHKGDMEIARLAAENAGLRAKAAVLEQERDAARANHLKVMNERDAALAQASAATGVRCKAVPEDECEAHGESCVGCRGYTPPSRGMRA